MGDVIDILELERPGAPEITKQSIMGTEKKKKPPKSGKPRMRKPEGMHRELYGLLYSDDKDAPPLMPVQKGIPGYKQVKAKLGLRHVRPWKWMEFKNPARSDNAVFHHWRRKADQDKEYPFAKFNKKVVIPCYTADEYSLVVSDEWSKEETDHLMDLCSRFDLRFHIIADRWDREKFTTRSVEQLKDRYYNIYDVIGKLHLPESEFKEVHFDAEHEIKRKQQLTKLYNRTQKQIDEEKSLLEELKKIEARKKEREKKTQDMQKLIHAADSNNDPTKKAAKKRLSDKKKQSSDVSGDSGIKFPDQKTSGVTLRSQRMKLPLSVGQKKIKAIEQLLVELSLDSTNLPMPTEDICTLFNELRSDIVLLYDLKLALASSEFELQTLRHQYEAMVPGKTLELPESLNSQTSSSGESGVKTEGISEVFDTSNTPLTPTRKRKAALEQSNIMKKVKART